MIAVVDNVRGYIRATAADCYVVDTTKAKRICKGIMNMIVVAILITAFGAILWKAMGYSFGPAYGRGQKWNRGIQKEILGTKPKNAVIIVSGGFYSERWEEKNFKKWIEASGKDTIQKWIKDDIITLRKLERPEYEHFLIIDEDVAHIEEKHIPGREPEGTIFVRKLYPESRTYFHNRFEELWEKGEQISEGNIKTLFSSPS
jgi:hypothetical protein